MRQINTLVIAAAASIVVAGCASHPAALTDSSGPLSLIGTWRIPDAAQSVSVTFAADGQISGTAACNSFTGRYAVSNGQIRVSEVSSTALGCPGAEPALRRLAPLLSAPVADVRTTSYGISLHAEGATLRLSPQ